MAMVLYRILYLPALLVALPYYLVRMWRRGGYRQGFSNRFGMMGSVPDKRHGVRRIWIQAVSVGELLAIESLVRELNQEPDVEVILTTTTSTGYRVLKDKLMDDTVWHGIFPLDFWLFSRMAWRRLDPDLAILMEGDLWPEHIHQAYRRGLPVLLINARLSDKSYKRHLRFKALTRTYFKKLDRILAGSETDLSRFQHLGWIPDDRILLSGNLKLDLAEPERLQAGERLALLRELGFLETDQPDPGLLLLLGSSTWPGEESALVDAYLSLRKSFAQLRLLLVPRHAERKKLIAADLRDKPVRLHFRSDVNQAPAGTEVYVADTTGELKTLTRSADLVFIGKSLPPNKGGQTPIEAAALGKPLIFGPDMSNFRDVSRRLVREGGAIRIHTGGDLTPTLKPLLESREKRMKMGQCAGAYIAGSRGSTQRIRRELLDAINRPV